MSIFDAMNMFRGMGQDMLNYNSRKVNRTDVNGVTVSTAYTSDCGYESAILDTARTHIVERYENREDAVAGHAKWVEFAKTAVELTDVGYGESIEPKVYTIKRKPVEGTNG